MTTRQSLRADYVAIALGAVSLALIMGALGFQYLGGLVPCEMCHWQRWPHIAATIVGLLGGGFLPRGFQASCLLTCGLFLRLAGGLLTRGLFLCLAGGFLLGRLLPRRW